MGVILFVLLSGFPPFRSPDRNQEELFRLIQKGEVHFLSPYWDNVSEGEILNSNILPCAKGLVHTKMEMLSSFTQPNVVSFLQDAPFVHYILRWSK